MRLNLTIGQRTGLGFGLLIALVLISSGVGVFYSLVTQENVDTASKGLDQVRATDEVQLSAARIVKAVDTMLLNEQTGIFAEVLLAEADRFDEHLADTQALMGEDWKAETDPVFERIKHTNGLLDRVIGRIIKQAEAGQWDTAYLMRMLSLNAVIDKLNTNVDLLEGIVRDNVDQATDDAAGSRQSSLITWLIVTLVSVIGGSFIGYQIMKSITRPIATLLEATQSIQSGQLDQRVLLTSRDELGTLAASFNDMASQLQDSMDLLEARVQEKTRNLELVTEVTNRAVSVLDVQELLQLVSDLTKETFNLYHAHIYTLDPKNQVLVLAAGAGEVGRKMVAQGHKIPLSIERSLVARAAREHRAVTVDNVRESPDFLPNPLLAETASELAVALVAGDQVVGVLDVQSDQPARFDADLRELMSTLAGQVAVAVHNAQLYTEAQRTSRHEHALSVITEQIQSATSLDDVLKVAVRELGKALHVPQTTVMLQLPDQPSETTDLSAASSMMNIS